MYVCNGNFGVPEMFGICKSNLVKQSAIKSYMSKNQFHQISSKKFNFRLSVEIFVIIYNIDIKKSYFYIMHSSLHKAIIILCM